MTEEKKITDMKELKNEELKEEDLKTVDDGSMGSHDSGNSHEGL